MREMHSLTACSRFGGSTNTSRLMLALYVFIYWTICANERHLINAENPYKNEEKYKQFLSLKFPEAISRSFPYYLSGYDYADRPIWIIELGKWNFKNLLERETTETIKKAEDYIEQLLFRIYNSPQKQMKQEALHTQIGQKTTPQDIEDKTVISSLEKYDESSSDGWVLIADMEGYDLEQLTSVKAIQFAIRLASKLELAAQNMEYGLVINANYVADRFINLLRPVLGNTLSKLDSYGTQSAIWKPKILKKIPRDQIPEFYGGSKNFKPIAIYG